MTPRQPSSTSSASSSTTASGAGSGAPPGHAVPPGSDEDLPEGEGSNDPRLRKRLEQFVPDLLKRSVYAGLGALFTTEEGIRKLAADFQLPKDVANYLIHQAANSKDEVLRIFAKELRGFLDNVNISGELQKLLTSLSFEIKTEIRFIPNDEAVGGVSPDIKRDVQVKRSKPDKAEKVEKSAGREAKRDDGGE